MSNKKYIKSFLLLISFRDVNISSYLSPILSQYNIKNDDFLQLFVVKFNELTRNFYKTQFDDFFSGEKKKFSTFKFYHTC